MGGVGVCGGYRCVSADRGGYIRQGCAEGRGLNGIVSATENEGGDWMGLCLR